MKKKHDDLIYAISKITTYTPKQLKHMERSENENYAITVLIKELEEIKNIIKTLEHVVDK